MFNSCSDSVSGLEFRKGQSTILLATDVASRGLGKAYILDVM